MITAALSSPEPLTSEHNVAGFVCSNDSLSQWLTRRALANSVAGASRTYVVCAPKRQVVGYYALAAGSIAVAVAPGRVRRNMPDPIPCIVLGRLAVHQGWTGRGIGAGLLKDAVLRALQASELIGVRALVCHAIDAGAKAFYVHHGFVESPHQPSLMLLGLG
ncbi:MAG: GNAT family N-acetyltransferase [Polyangiaceae bacterium]|nr:GNAT family N-acetyltransferase [Polyangiaceae bacterium]